MATTSIDRIAGVRTTTAIKAPALVATTANITLSGEQTIDDIAVVAGDRVLVKDQTDGTENGLWDVATGAWSRSRDFNSDNEITEGTVIYINRGTTNQNIQVRLDTADPSIGVTNLVFEIVTGTASVTSVNTKTGVVVVDPDDLNDAATTNKFTTAGDISKLAGIEAGATAGGAVDSVNTQTGVVVLDADDISDAATTNKFTTAGEISKLAGIEALADVTDEAGVVAHQAALSLTESQISDLQAYLLPAAIGVTVQGYDVDTIKADTADTLTVGFDSADFNAGTKSTGTYTPAAADGNFQRAINGGAHTLAPPTTSCSIVVQYTNDASAGTITTTGFTAVTGDAFTTTNGDDFMCVLTRCNGFSVLNVTALQ